MSLLQISLNLTQLPKRLVKVDADGTALESGYTKIGTFEHPENTDPRGPAVNHVIYHHVQDALYKVKAGQVVAVGFWPDNITDMQTVDIEYDEPAGDIEIDFISPNSGTVTVGVGAEADNVIFYNPEDATDKTLTVASSAPAVATAEYTGPLGGGSKATGVTVTGVSAGTATITLTTVNGKTATFGVTVNNGT